MIKVLFVNVINTEDAFAKSITPLGLGYLASYSKLHLGDEFNFKIINNNYMNEVESYRPDIIAITCVSQNYNRAIKFSTEVREKYPTPIIIGGIHISMMPMTLHNTMDIGVIGEGEQTFLELMQHYIKYNNFVYVKLESIPGLVYRYIGITLTENRTPIKNLDVIPTPFRENIGEMTNMFTSRGCPYDCVFCSSTRFWKTTRFFSAEYVVNEIMELVNKHNVKHISFSDDLFIANKTRLKRISELLPKNKITIDCACRANLVSKENIKLLKQMGCTTISLGLESGCEKTLKYLKGNSVTIEDNTKAVEIIKKYGININANFIIGAPHETKEDILETLKFIRSSKINNFSIYLLTPLPSTPVWEFAESKNLIPENFRWESLEFKFKNRCSDSIIVSQILTEKELYELYLLFEKEQKKRARISIIKKIPTIIFNRLKNILR
jgi:radical SAM superfamily enzyme YgiQ (UPF0313 family)